MPISAAYTLTEEWRWGIVVCQFWLATDYTASTASIFSLVILSLDRYWSVSSPLKYLRKRTRKRALILIGGSWVAASLWLMPVLSWHHIAFKGMRSHPPHVCETEFSSSVTFKLVTAALNFYVPSVLMLCLYWRIYRTIKERSKSLVGRVTFGTQEQTTDKSETERNCFDNDRQGASYDSWKRTNTSAEDSLYQELTVIALNCPESSSAQQPVSRYCGISVIVEHLPENDATLIQNKVSQKKKHCRNATWESHEHHLACYPVCRRKENQNEVGSSSSPSGSEQWASFRSFRNGDHKRTISGFREFLNRKNEGRGIRGSIRQSSRKAGPMNIIKERKAAKQLGVIMGAFLICWLPYFVMFLVIAFCDYCISPRTHLAAIWLGYLNSALNPVLYPLCNENFRRAFARMLKCPWMKRQNSTLESRQKVAVVNVH